MKTSLQKEMRLSLGNLLQRECAIAMQRRPYSYGVSQQSSPGKALAPRSRLPGTRSTHGGGDTRCTARTGFPDGWARVTAGPSQSTRSLIPPQSVETDAQTARTDLLQRRFFSLPHFVLICQHPGTTKGSQCQEGTALVAKSRPCQRTMGFPRKRNKRACEIAFSFSSFACSRPVKKTKSRVIYVIVVVRRKACLGFVLGKKSGFGKGERKGVSNWCRLLFVIHCFFTYEMTSNR